MHRNPSPIIIVLPTRKSTWNALRWICGSPGRFHCAAVQRVPVDHHHRRRLFYTNPIRAGVDSYEPFQGPGVFLLAGRTLRVFCPAQVQ